MRFLSTDLGLFIDTLHAVRPDASLEADYPAIPFQTRIGDRIVELSTEEQKENFWFAKDTNLDFPLKTIKRNTKTTFYRTGNSFSFERKPLMPFCKKINQGIRAVFEENNGVINLGLNSNQEPVIKATIIQGEPVIKIFSEEEFSETACLVTQGMIREFPLLQFAILPQSPDFNTREAGIFIELSLPEQLNEATKAKIISAIGSAHG